MQVYRTNHVIFSFCNFVLQKAKISAISTRNHLVIAAER